MMNYLAVADEQQNRQEATAPENSKTANMVILGIEWLHHLVQKPPSDYASTNRDDESVMAATSESEILVENALSSERTQERQEGMPSLAPQSNTIDVTEPFSATISQ